MTSSGASNPEHPDAEVLRELEALDAHFLPGAPVASLARLKGRTEQISQLLNAVSATGEHAVIFGEPGAGKTSLSLVVQSILSDTHNCIRVGCQPTDNVDDIWRRVLDVTGDSLDQRLLPHTHNLQACVDEGRARMAAGADVLTVIDRLAGAGPLVVLLDEFDRLETDWTVRAQTSNLIKSLSDARVPATIVLVGVAGDAHDLVAEHRSVARSLVQVPVPRLSTAELGEILREGFAAAAVVPDDDLVNNIVAVSRGLPHYVHLLGRHVGRIAVLGGSGRATMDTWASALDQTSTAAAPGLLEDYDGATVAGRASLLPDVALACALAIADEWGRFTSDSVGAALEALTGVQRRASAHSRHLQALADPDDRGVLEQRGEGARALFRFANPLLQPFIIIEALRSGRITTATLALSA